MHGPSPDTAHPMPGFPQVCFLRNTVRNPHIVIGEYTYYDDPDGAEHFEQRNVLYHFPFIGDRLVIGRFCAIARGAKFIMNGANHRMSGISTYPFQIFGNGWEKAMPAPGDLPTKGDTVVGHDVWIGYDALVMPGVRIGDGAIVAARAVVTADVAPYTVVGGNPARPIRERFPPEVAQRLCRIAWWDWPVETITQYLDRIVAGDVEALAQCRPDREGGTAGR
ncbi:Vat family streptogramin A O-acetyltransferase [uncultured Xylophilus sp.]|uniref:Vat family streptogramin A O-acetyltransferase n=1 Tax=uncultured Xylophilus sp. TaxID=296832 RepID=UPI0026010644|nr:Vat family streptogramin A O-acetyltransferase [uncultured Xylophilus sp.]